MKLCKCKSQPVHCESGLKIFMRFSFCGKTAATHRIAMQLYLDAVSNPSAVFAPLDTFSKLLKILITVLQALRRC